MQSRVYAAQALSVFGLRPSRRPPFIRLLPPSYDFSSISPLDRLLGDELLAPTVLEADPAPVAEGELGRIWREVGESRKWYQYFAVYERELKRFRGTECTLLEIGIERGGSLEIWRRYLGERARIVGIDIDARCRRRDAPARNIHVRIGSQADESFLRAVVEEFGPFDIVVDDGSHVTSHMIASFRHLFPRLKPGGVYFVEDLHANYWRKYRDIPETFFDFAKRLTDLIHAPYFAAPTVTRFSMSSPNRRAAMKVPAIAAMLESITVQDSIAVLRRYAGQRTLPTEAAP